MRAGCVPRGNHPVIPQSVSAYSATRRRNYHIPPKHIILIVHAILKITRVRLDLNRDLIYGKWGADACI